MHSLQPLPNKPLYQAQDSLPKLPVPSLTDTAAKYLDSIKPLLAPSEFAVTKSKVEQFLKDPYSNALQQRLVERNEKAETNWLYEWWNYHGYMNYRDPLPIFVSYFFVFKDLTKKVSPAARAASLITATLEYKNLILSQDLLPESTKQYPLSMDQYQYLFNSCRIPKIPADVNRKSDDNGDLIVLRKNRVFVVKTNQSGRTLSTSEIEVQLNHIYNTAVDPALPVGILTTENRDIWTLSREELMKSGVNKNILDTIERAAFVVCLDDATPVTREESSRLCWHGSNGENRWYDKPVQLIVWDNAKAGFCGEHSMMDGVPTSKLCEYICDSVAKEKIAKGGVADMEMPQELVFEVSQKFGSDVVEARKHIKELIEGHQLKVQAYFGHGKNLIKVFKTSPDAYVQMAIQLAAYKYFKSPQPTYESATTRKFKYGRTETCRTLSSASLFFTQTFESETPLSTKAVALRNAIKSHSEYMADCVEARGCDRHLFGLGLSIQNGEEKPEFMKEEVFSKSKNWVLSTSQITSEWFDGYGWGEVVPEGFGIAYMIKEKSVHFNVTCRKEVGGAERMAYYLGEALNEMREVMESELVVKAKAKL